MSDDAHDKHFSPEKIFLWLIIFTAAEVIWGVWGPDSKVALWGGLLFCAFLKGWLIAVYFMHLRFEGWVVKSLILPTPFLIMVFFGYVSPDIAAPDHMIYPLGSMVDVETGKVHDILNVSHDADESGAEDAGQGEG